LLTRSSRRRVAPASVSLEFGIRAVLKKETTVPIHINLGPSSYRCWACRFPSRTNPIKVPLPHSSSYEHIESKTEAYVEIPKNLRLGREEPSLSRTVIHKGRRYGHRYVTEQKKGKGKEIGRKYMDGGRESDLRFGLRAFYFAGPIFFFLFFFLTPFASRPK